MKTSITPSQRLQIIGLLTLAYQHDHKVRAARDGVVELLEGEAGTNVADHVSDAVWQSIDPDPVAETDALLVRLRVAVDEA